MHAQASGRHACAAGVRIPRKRVGGCNCVLREVAMMAFAEPEVDPAWIPGLTRDIVDKGLGLEYRVFLQDKPRVRRTVPPARTPHRLSAHACVHLSTCARVLAARCPNLLSLQHTLEHSHRFPRLASGTERATRGAGVVCCSMHDTAPRAPPPAPGRAGRRRRLLAPRLGVASRLRPRPLLRRASP